MSSELTHWTHWARQHGLPMITALSARFNLLHPPLSVSMAYLSTFSLLLGSNTLSYIDTHSSPSHKRTQTPHMSNIHANEHEHEQEQEQEHEQEHEHEDGHGSGAYHVWQIFTTHWHTQTGCLPVKAAAVMNMYISHNSMISSFPIAWWLHYKAWTHCT